MGGGDPLEAVNTSRPTPDSVASRSSKPTDSLMPIAPPKHLDPLRSVPSSRGFRLSRFERKIFVAILAVAIMPLAGTLLLGREALHDAYRVGVNPRVRAELEGSLEIYRRHFVALRDDAERTADAIAFHHRATESLAAADLGAAEDEYRSLLERYPNVARVTVATSPPISLGNPDLQGSDRQRLLTLERTIDLPDRPLGMEVTVATAVAPFEAYQRAGELMEIYRHLETGTGYVSNAFLSAYILLLVVVIVVALLIGVVLSRRVTRRIVDLVGATQRVGAGDLEVSVPTGSNDEIGDLTHSFNAMVRDMRESRERIDYLQRIGAWQEFARRLAHEIKNPLTPIQLAAQEMHRAYEGSDDAYRQKLADACAIIEEEVATLRRFVGEFSAFAKLPQAELAQADLGDFLAEIEPAVALAISELGTGSTLIFDRGSRPLPVHIDAMMLKRCVDNLVQNAAQALASGNRTDPTIVVSSQREGEFALLDVRDNGPGLPPARRERVFDPYFTTKPEGTGLGLAIVKKIVLEHGGAITYEDAAGGGALFRVRIPLVGRAARDDLARRAKGARGPGVSSASSPSDRGRAADDRSRGEGDGPSDGARSSRSGEADRR